jgi:hypothetical protein
MAFLSRNLGLVMSATHIAGKEVVIKKSQVSIFASFNDLNRFTEHLPEEYRSQVTADDNSIHFNVKGMNFGIRVKEKIPYSRIIFEDDMSPIHFNISFFFEAMGLSETLFHIELDIELNPMMKMMLGNKLQEAMDQATDQIEKAVISGNMPDVSPFKPEDFN